MPKDLLISSTSLETRLAILEEDQTKEIFIERTANRGILGNICKGKVTRVLPGMQAAFVDVGLDRDAFLYVGDFLEDYEEFFEVSGADEAWTSLDRQGGQRSAGGTARTRQGRQSSQDSRGSRGGQGRQSSQDSRGNRGGQGRQSSQDSRGNRGGQGRQSSQDSRGNRGGQGRQSSQDSRGSRSSSQNRSLFFRKDSQGQGGQAKTAADRKQEDRQSVFADDNLASSKEPSRWSSRLPGESHHLLPDSPKTVVDFNPDKSAKEDPPDTEARLRRKPPAEKLAMPWRRRQNKRRGSPADRVLIDDVLRQGQEILVQVAKEPLGKKGARITSHVALPGRYLVFMPNVEHVGVSRQIESSKERQRLKKIIAGLLGNTKRGFIVRTVGAGASKEDFQRDMQYLTDLWEDIRRKTEKSSAPALIHRESSLVHRVIRDHFSDEFRSIVVDDEQEYEGIVNIVNRFNPSLVKRVRLYNKKLPLFDDYGVSADLERALRQKVWLKKGGYIVINQTEALVAIDVNSGRFVGNSNSLEETTTKVNLEAVREIARQIRLRNLGGIIIIDFIDMDVKKNRMKVMSAFQAALAEDKTPTKILPFNDFGLVAITRKRVRQSLDRILGQPCAYCDGTGVTRSIRTVCYTIYEKLRRMLPSLEGTGEIVIHCHLDVSKFLRSDNKMILREMEELTSRNISVKTDSTMHIEHFDIVESGSWTGHE